MNTENKLRNWAEVELRIKRLQGENNKLKEKIEAEVFVSGIEIRLDEGPKCILTSKGGVYDWQSIALELRPSEELIELNTEIHWNKVAEQAATDSAILEEVKTCFYKKGESIAQCRVK